MASWPAPQISSASGGWITSRNTSARPAASWQAAYRERRSPRAVAAACRTRPASSGPSEVMGAIAGLVQGQEGPHVRPGASLDGHDPREHPWLSGVKAAPEEVEGLRPAIRG